MNSSIEGKASSNHNHDSIYAKLNHTHSISDIINLQSTLDGKQPKGDYATASHTHHSIEVDDTRNVNHLPNASEYPQKMSLDFKRSSTVGLSSDDNYLGIMSLFPWADSSGGGCYELAFTTANTYATPKLYIRSAQIEANSWNSWHRLYHTGDKPTCSEIGAAPSNHTHGSMQIVNNGSSWITGKFETNCIVGGKQDSAGKFYWKVIRINTGSNHVWNIGGLGDRVGIYGYFASRTENGYDFETTWNCSTGDVYNSSSFDIGGRYKQNGTVGNIVAVQSGGPNGNMMWAY